MTTDHKIFARTEFGERRQAYVIPDKLLLLEELVKLVPLQSV